MGKGAKFLWVAAILALAFCWAFASPTPETVALSLEQAVNLALERHPDVQQARLSLRVAELELEAARLRSAIPSFSLQVAPPELTAQGLSSSVQGAFGMALSLPWGTGTSLVADLKLAWDSKTGRWTSPGWGLTYSQRLDLARLDAGSAELRAKQRAVAEARSALEQARETVVLETIEAYSNLLTTKALLAQAEAALQRAEDYQAQVQEQVHAGLKGESSLLEAKLELLDAKIALEQSRSAYATAKAGFGRAIGIDEDYEPLPLELPLEDLARAAREPLEEAILEAAISNAPEVRAAQEKVSAAEEALRAARLEALPELGLEAGLDGQGWRIGWTISFELFRPDRALNVKIAAINLELAKSQLAAARERMRSSILNLEAALRKALEELERLPLEEEKWALEETVNKAKLEAGLLSESDWHTFQEEKSRFEQAARERGVALLLAYLRYRASLGLALDWEGWVR
jgi:outer membrane protein TolC